MGLAAAAVVALAATAVVAAAVAEDQQQNDDPPPVVVSEAAAQTIIVVTHHEYLQEKIGGFCRSFHGIPSGRKCAASPLRQNLTGFSVPPPAPFFRRFFRPWS